MHTFKTALLKLLPSLIVAASIIAGTFIISKSFERSLLETHELTRSYNREVLKLTSNTFELFHEIRVFHTSKGIQDEDLDGLIQCPY